MGETGRKPKKNQFLAPFLKPFFPVTHAGNGEGTGCWAWASSLYRKNAFNIFRAPVKTRKRSWVVVENLDKTIAFFWKFYFLNAKLSLESTSFRKSLYLLNCCKFSGTPCIHALLQLFHRQERGQMPASFLSSTDRSQSKVSFSSIPRPPFQCNTHSGKKG